MILTSTFTAALKFAAHASSKKDVRYYLMGVCFEIKGDTLHLVGTDGCRAAIASLQLIPAPAYDGQFVVGTESVKQILASFAKDKGEVTFKIEAPVAPSTTATLTVEAGGVTIAPKILDGRFPDWTRIVPAQSQQTGTMPNLDAVLVAQACAAIEPMCGLYLKSAPIRFGAAGPTSSVTVRPSRVFDDRLVDCVVVISQMKV